MKKPPVRADEKARLQELRRFNILDTLPEQIYEDLVALASQICQTPICNLTLVDENRQWFKATKGLSVRETSRESSFCAHAIFDPQEVLVVEDATKDERFQDNPLVTGAPHIRFYAGAPLVTSQGVPLGALCVIDTVPRELSKDQKAALQALSRQAMSLLENQLALENSQLESSYIKALVGSMNSGILFLSPDMTVTFVNEYFCKMFGYSQGPESLIGGKAKERMGDFIDRIYKNPAGERTRIMKLLEAPEEVRAEEVKLTDERTIERDFLPVYFENNYVGNMWIYRDITQKKLQEEILSRELVKSESLSKLKSEFLANMSHEIRTPLNGIIGLSGLLLESPLNEEQKEITENVKNAGESLLEIVNDILDYSKIESQKMELELEPFSIHDCIEQSLYLLDYRASQKGINLSYRVDSRLPKLVMGDSGRLKQVLINLIGNAVKFTPKGGVLVSVSSKRTNDDLYIIEFSVNDSGIGIPQDRVTSLFKSFSQVDASTSRRYGGTGLGLAISKSLCELMGGSIWVESKEGQGSTFHFTIAVRSADQLQVPEKQTIAVPAPTAPVMSEHPLKILVVEDNAVNLKLTINLLRKFGYKADVAGNGLEAVAAVKNIAYDLILMDVQMPEMSGLEATEAIRLMDLPQGQPKIIAVTANAMKEDQEKCIASGMDDYLSKPLRPELLQEKILKWSSAAPAKIDLEPALQKVLDENFVGDFSMFADVAGILLSEGPGLLVPLKDALVSQDRVSLKKAAHKLKGSVGYFHLKDSLEMAKMLEAKSAELSFEEMSGHIKQLEIHLEKLLSDVAAMVELRPRKSA